MPNVAFKSGGRTGNNIFQYLMTQWIKLKYGHTYVPNDSLISPDHYYFQEHDMVLLFNDQLEEQIKNRDVICDGYFQKTDLFIKYRSEILAQLKESEDYWISEGDKVYIKDFIKPSSETFHNVIVMSLRLDDFIQLCSPTSDIIPPKYYLDILEEVVKPEYKLYIVMDKVRHDWERKYIEYFDKWKPTYIRGELMSDFAVLKDCEVLIHSNSTFCWIASFFSETKTKRYIPNTHFYKEQFLCKIDPTDLLISVKPLAHNAVYALNMRNDIKKNIYPLSYSIPDEYVVNTIDMSNKIHIQSEIRIGNRTNYMFNAGQEDMYHDYYRKCLFSATKKKGGWDCLRHYEILANGCIPLFENLDNCPKMSLTTLPKQLIKESHKELIPYTDDKQDKYIEYSTRLVHHIRNHCTTSASTRYVLNILNKPLKRVLLILGDQGVNYTREFFWIGMKRYIQSIGGVAVEYPKMDYVYTSYPVDQLGGLYGNGYGYSRKLENDYEFTNEEIMDKVKTKYFDLIVYGKVGPDEGHTGTIPNFPLWEHVFKRYTRNEIICLYGGDECIDLTYTNKYSEHIYNTLPYAKCFVRELNM